MQSMICKLNRKFQKARLYQIRNEKSCGPVSSTLGFLKNTEIIGRLALAQTQNTSPKEIPWANVFH